MHRTRGLWVGILLVTSMALAAPGPASAQSGEIYLPYLTGNENYVRPNDNYVEMSDFASRVVRLVNQQRARQGCPPLTVDPRLATVAMVHSRNMALNDYFAHEGPDIPGPGDRIAATGYDSSMWGENLAAGAPSPETVVAAWMGSDSHQSIIEDCSFQETGAGYYYLEDDTGSINYNHYWTHIFAVPQ